MNLLFCFVVYILLHFYHTGPLDAAGLATADVMPVTDTDTQIDGLSQSSVHLSQGHVDVSDGNAPRRKEFLVQ